MRVRFKIVNGWVATGLTRRFGPGAPEQLLRRARLIEIWIGDDSEASCGENRTDWRCVARPTVRDLGLAVLRLAQGVTEREDF